MKLHSILKNNRGGKKSTSDDIRILVELSYKNQIIGEIGLYSILDSNTAEDLGYRLVFQDNTTPIGGQIIKEVEQKITDETKIDRLLKDQDNIREQEIQDL